MYLTWGLGEKFNTPERTFQSSVIKPSLKSHDLTRAIWRTDVVSYQMLHSVWYLIAGFIS